MTSDFSLSAAVETRIATEPLYRFQTRVLESYQVHLILVPLGRLWSEQGLVVINSSEIWRILGGISRRLQMRRARGFSH